LKIGEALVYAIGKALDESGAQSQVILQDMGREITQRLIEQGFLTTTNDPVKAAESVSIFFASTGLLDEARLTKQDDVLIVEWRNWRILESIRSLNSKGCKLIPCPFTQAVFSLFRMNGFALQAMSDLQIVDATKRIARQEYKLLDLKSKSFEEEAHEVSRAMDSELKSD
jgi:hypothetical protein